MEIELPYLHWDDPFPYDVVPFGIEPLNCEKRIRVYCNQFLNTIVENSTKKNYLFHVSLYHKYGKKIVEKCPEKEEDVLNASILLWQKIQMKFKKGD